MIGRRLSHETGAPGAVPDFGAAVADIHARAGKNLLTRDDLIILAAASLSRTYALEEKGYSSGSLSQPRTD
jgi:hypothetical protein